MNTLSHTHRVTDWLERWITHDLIALAARFGIGAIFFISGRTKVEGWFTLTDTTFLLFREDYALPLIPPEWAAYLATGAEHLFPVLLVLGLATRLSAAALLGMTAVIQFLVYPSAWPTHLTWAVPLLYLLGRGAGRVSVDGWLVGLWFRSGPPAPAASASPPHKVFHRRS